MEATEVEATEVVTVVEVKVGVGMAETLAVRTAAGEKEEEAMEEVGKVAEGREEGGEGEGAHSCGRTLL